MRIPVFGDPCLGTLWLTQTHIFCLNRSLGTIWCGLKRLKSIFKYIFPKGHLKGFRILRLSGLISAFRFQSFFPQIKTTSMLIFLPKNTYLSETFSQYIRFRTFSSRNENRLDIKDCDEFSWSNLVQRWSDDGSFQKSDKFV